MNTRAYVGNLLFCATENLLRWLRVTQSEVASVGAVQGESTGRSRGFAWSGRPASVELEPTVAKPLSALTRTPLTRPVWSYHALPGVMAGRRPAWPVWVNGTLSGAMAGERPAPRPTGAF